MFGLRGKRKVADVQTFDGPTSAGGATLNVYTFENGDMETVEYSWGGAELVRYAGEPRAVPPGVRMPDPPPRPRGAPPLPPGLGRPPATPAAPLEASPPNVGPPPTKGGDGGVTSQPQPSRRTGS